MKPAKIPTLTKTPKFPEKTAQWIMRTGESWLSELYLVASPEGLHGIFWKQQAVPLLPTLEASRPEVKILRQAVRELGEYLRGERRRFTLKLEPRGTAFQMKVWKELAKIPFGETTSYSAIAAQIRNEKAVRAVGTANGRNPLSIVVPCHRVIHQAGSLGGYAGGLEVKTKLLELEKRVRARRG